MSKGPSTKRPRRRLTLSADSRTLGDEVFAAISAVEGIELSDTSRGRLSAMRQRGLSLSEQRSEVFRAYLKRS